MPNPVAIVGQSAYTDDIGDFHIVGEVQNTSNQTIKSVQLVVSIYDSTHTIIGTASGYSDIDVLRPGERSAFSLSPSSIANNTPISYYQFSTSWQPATGQEKPAFLTLVIGRTYLDGSTYHVVGQVTNYGDRSANSIKVSSAFYGYNNQVMGQGDTYVTPDSLPPGQTAPFDISVDSIPNQLIASASYNTQSQEYSMINNALPKIPSSQLDQPAVISVRPQQSLLSANTKLPNIF